MLLFCDSFETYTDPAQKYDTVVANASISSTFARNGSFSLKCTGGAGYVIKNFTSRSTYILGFALYISSQLAVDTCAVLGDSGTPQVGLGIDTAGTFTVVRGPTIAGGVIGGTLLGTGSSLISFNAWHYIELKVKINSTTGTVDLKLDGINILSLTGQNTQNSTNATANQVYLGSITNNGPTYYFDDFYICDTAGSSNNTFLGDTAVLARFPSANGSLNNFTNVFASWAASTSFPAGTRIKDSNGNIQQSSGGTSGSGSHPTWATTGGATTAGDGSISNWTVIGSGANPGAADWMGVSERPPDDNSSYVTDATPGDIDRYTYPSITGSQVFAAVVNLRAEKDDAGTRTIRAAVKSGGTSSDNGSDFGLTLSSYAYFQGIFETDPNTGVAWTVAGVNAAEFGIKTTA